jgi:hypothetical protein
MPGAKEISSGVCPTGVPSIRPTALGGTDFEVIATAFYPACYSSARRFASSDCSRSRLRFLVVPFEPAGTGLFAPGKSRIYLVADSVRECATACYSVTTFERRLGRDARPSQLARQ